MDETTNHEEMPVLTEAEIMEVFQQLQLSSAADRERFLKMEKLGEPEGSETSSFGIRFGDSTSPIAA